VIGFDTGTQKKDQHCKITKRDNNHTPNTYNKASSI